MERFSKGIFYILFIMLVTIMTKLVFLPFHKIRYQNLVRYCCLQKFFLKNNITSSYKKKQIKKQFTLISIWKLGAVFAIHILESIILYKFLYSVLGRNSQQFLWFNFVKRDITLILPFLYGILVVIEEISFLDKKEFIEHAKRHLLIAAGIGIAIFVSSKEITSEILIFWMVSGVYRILVKKFYFKPCLYRKIIDECSELRMMQVIDE